MNQIKIYKDGEADYTSISNLFIDEYMAGANDAQIKIYLPNIEEQSRIVSILDSFEASIANLEEQLALRQKQYEYYRNKVLTFE